jgi:assimilatory nitrate reductase catalytic subunit
MSSRMRDQLRRLLHDAQGPLTRELVRKPGGFGLGQIPERLLPDATTTMICGFCSTGCGLDVHLSGGEAINLSPAADYPVNLGMACPKGWEALAPLSARDRATHPLARNARGALERVSWARALETFTTRVKDIQERHGRESFAFLSTGQIPSEEMALLGAVAKFGMGMKHGDGNTRQCMATAVVAYKECFGFDAPPYTYADFEESDLIVLVGANLCIAHPILWERVCKNRRGGEVVVVDPRRTETAEQASLHLPIRPKSDLHLFYGLAHLLFERGGVDWEFVRAHTDGVEDFRAHVAAFTPARVAEATGLPVASLIELAEKIKAKERVSFWWTMGVNQSHEGVRTAQSLIALALLTGNIGRPGTGANSITGQCNAMGSRLFSNTTNLLGGHDFGRPEHRAKVARILGIDEAVIPDAPSQAYDQILEGIHRGEIRGLWIIATNTAHSWINQDEARELLGRLDFLVVQDMYATTETAQRADLVLPAAGWGEKEGTFINSERRVGLLKKVRRAPGEALADFHIVRLLAEAYGCGEMFRRWDSPEAVFGLLTRLSEGQPCDITGIDGYATIDEARGIQWPLPRGATADRSSERRLFEDGRFFTPNGKARFVFGEPSAPAETPCGEYPLWLLTGRGSSSQWHTQTRTRKSKVLEELSPRGAYVEIHPEDAARHGITSGAAVTVTSKRGSMRARAFVTRTVREGQVFIPMHYEETNRLTFPSFDPHSRQPSYKAAAVRVDPA